MWRSCRRGKGIAHVHKDLRNPSCLIPKQVRYQAALRPDTPAFRFYTILRKSTLALITALALWLIRFFSSEVRWAKVFPSSGT